MELMVASRYCSVSQASASRRQAFCHSPKRNENSCTDKGAIQMSATASNRSASSVICSWLAMTTSFAQLFFAARASVIQAVALRPVTSTNRASARAMAAGSGPGAQNTMWENGNKGSVVSTMEASSSERPTRQMLTGQWYMTRVLRRVPSRLR